MKAFVRSTERLAHGLSRALGELRTDVRIALLHFSPTKDTLGGERLELYPFLGSYLLGEAIDRAGADLVVHGHAHHGAEHGFTGGGIPVRNVALPVISHAFRLYSLPARGERPAEPTAGSVGRRIGVRPSG
jgi:Icc-related predicted phosphoesterase